MKIIIDTDPGQDDALAILLALGSPEIELLGIVAVAGNVPLPLTSKNVRKVCELARRSDVPVYAGAARPLVRDLFTAEYCHGATGLDGPALPEPTMPLRATHGVDFIVDTVMTQRDVTLCVLGPMTNVALALIREPRVAKRLKRIVAMGGGLFEGGNTTPAAEFNIYVDPHAADLVLRSGVPVTMLPLDVTHRCLTSPARIARFREMGTPVGDTVAAWLDFFERYDVEKYGTDGGPLHDPNVIAWLLRPDLYRGRDIHVAIETASPLTVGMTVADWWGVTGRPANCTWVREVDAQGFFDLLTERLASL